ncbi:MAG: hypothetical protein AAF770_00445 [Bacteroidota bacterium]
MNNNQYLSCQVYRRFCWLLFATINCHALVATNNATEDYWELLKDRLEKKRQLRDQYYDHIKGPLYRVLVR